MIIMLNGNQFMFIRDKFNNEFEDSKYITCIINGVITYPTNIWFEDGCVILFANNLIIGVIYRTEIINLYLRISDDICEDEISGDYIINYYKYVEAYEKY